MKVGDKVRIVRDEYEQLIGFTGTIERFSDDGTTAVVSGRIPFWCSVSHLEVIDED